ncbi:UNVERIFIED_CONTAM: hypothetical protein GTU68_045970 [Idotea baltica]|nr:hypothetical protein [Idotea baltica]
MSYVDGFVAAVPTAKKEQYIEYAKKMGQVCKEYGVLSVIDNWGDDVPNGEVTSFPMAVQCEEDETVVFSWMLWPSKKVRDTGWKAMMEDSRMHPDNSPMPFDGKRLIYGGFENIVDM